MIYVLADLRTCIAYVQGTKLECMEYAILHGIRHLTIIIELEDGESIGL